MKQLLTIVLLCIAGFIVVRHFFGAPIASTQSAFFRDYSADQVSSEFGADAPRQSTSTQPARQFVANSREIDSCFVLSNEQIPFLMRALRSDLSAQLHQTDAHVLSDGGTVDQGFRVTYRLGTTVGSASISYTDATGIGQCPGMQTLPDSQANRTVMAQISIHEHWFSSPSAAMRGSSQIP